MSTILQCIHTYFHFKATYYIQKGHNTICSKHTCTVHILDSRGCCLVENSDIMFRACQVFTLTLLHDVSLTSIKYEPRSMIRYYCGFMMLYWQVIFTGYKQCMEYIQTDCWWVLIEEFWFQIAAVGGSYEKKFYSMSYKGYCHCTVTETFLLLVACKSHRVGRVLKMHQMDSQAEEWGLPYCSHYCIHLQRTGNYYEKSCWNSFRHLHLKGWLWFEHVCEHVCVCTCACMSHRSLC